MVLECMIMLDLFFIKVIVLFQVEGKGNGIKTVIVNMSEIAKALSRPPTCKICHYISSLYEHGLPDTINVTFCNSCEY